ncbi:MAG: MarR family transcriptional regulator [Alphaproteobacteria bacterium]|nr:MarR family transcriptional regulator [Alphaproteobacteria bacterium]
MSRERSETQSVVPKKRLKGAAAWPSFVIAHDAIVWRIEERLKAEGLPEMSWYVVLWTLQSVPEKRLRMNELAERSVLPRSNVTRLVDRMERAGLVERERCGRDRRGWYARILPAGEAMKSKMWDVYGPAVRELFTSQMNSEESAVLRDVMDRLYANATKDGGLFS